MNVHSFFNKSLKPVRLDQANNTKFLSLKIKLVEGLESGVSPKPLPDIMKEVEARMRTDGQL